MGNFSNLKNVDIPYRSDTMAFKKFIRDTSASIPYYQSTGSKEVDEDNLTILDDFEFQGIDFGNIREDEFQLDCDDDDEDDSNDKVELNFQEYSVSYVENDSSIKTINFKKEIIDVNEINQQAQSSPKFPAHELNDMICNLSLDELDFQLRGDEEESLDSKQPDESFNLEELLGSVQDQDTAEDPHVEDDFEEQLFEEVRGNSSTETDEDEKDDDDTMDVDVVLPGSSSSLTLSEEENNSTYEKLNDFLKSPQLSSKMSKIPVRYVPHETTEKIQIHQDPTKALLPVRHRPMSLYQQTLKKSARLQPQDYHRILKSPNRICSPKRSIKPSKSALKVRKNLLNLIVDAASGDQKEAARYGTEINSQNCEGVPLPESTKELVTIPTNNAKETHKAAIIKAIQPVLCERKLQDVTKIHNQQVVKEVGFYSEREFQKYLSEKKSSYVGKENEYEVPAKRMKINTGENVIPDKKQVKWADSLEW